MKIKSLGYISTRLIYKNVTFITDPISAKEVTGSFTKVKGDVILHTDKAHLAKEGIVRKAGIDSKFDVNDERELLEINNPGEYEIGEVFIRRPLGSNMYILDEGDVRVIYVGEGSKDVSPDAFKNLGDVDVLIIPGGDGEKFMGWEKLGKVIATADPTFLVPTGFAHDSVNVDGLKTSEEFIKHFGYTNVVEEKILRIKKGKETDNKIMNVVLLQV